MESRQDQDYLSPQPDEILLEVASSSPTAVALGLSKTSPRFLPTFFEENKLSLNLLRQLLNYGALGEL